MWELQNHSANFIKSKFFRDIDSAERSQSFICQLWNVYQIYDYALTWRIIIIVSIAWPTLMLTLWWHHHYLPMIIRCGCCFFALELVMPLLLAEQCHYLLMICFTHLKVSLLILMIFYSFSTGRGSAGGNGRWFVVRRQTTAMGVFRAFNCGKFVATCVKWHTTSDNHRFEGIL